MSDVVTIDQIITELIYPLFGLFGVIFRGLGGFLLGLMVGRIISRTTSSDNAMDKGFLFPATVLGFVALFGVMAFGQWSSPGTLGLLAIGVFSGYMSKSRKADKNSAGDDDYFNTGEEA